MKIGLRQKIAFFIKKRKVNILLMLNFIFMIGLLVYAVSSMRDDYFNSIGKRAMSFSLVTSNELQLSNEETNRLIGLDFSELLLDKTNTIFEDYVRQFMRNSEVKYVYFLHQLNENQIKYYVDKDEEEYYGLPAGTPLDAIYLIDAVIDEDTRLEDTDYMGYIDKDRYTYLDDEIQAIYDNREADYVFYKDEWGTYISGFTPIYSTEGEYIGMLGADIFLDEYIQLLTHRIVILFVFCFLILILMIGLLNGYRKINKIESVVDDLKAKAYYDELTGLYNRSTLKEQQKKYNALLMEDNKRVATLMIDIDCFKCLNDKYGHLKGDESLIAVSNIIKSVLQGNGQSFRYGGDEFIILLVDRELTEIQKFAEILREMVENIDILGVEEKITVSIGIAYKQSNEKLNLKTLLEKADNMLYQSKKKGKNMINVDNI